MKAILIDPVEKSVQYVESDSDFPIKELHQLVGAEVLDFCRPFGKTEQVAVDDLGMSKELTRFWIEGYQWPIFGRAVIMGCDAVGETRETRLSVEEVHKRVEFERKE